MAYNSFDETILGLLDIATQAGYMFEKSSNNVINPVKKLCTKIFDFSINSNNNFTHSSSNSNHFLFTTRS